MKNKEKLSRGITLISLVVTIIVLLILAGVALTMLSGENGIMTRAKTAREQHEAAQELEENRLAGMENVMDQYLGNTASGYTTGGTSSGSGTGEGGSGGTTPTPQTVTYTVIFNSNDGTETIVEQEFTVGIAQNLSTNTFTRNGYEFLGWNEDKDATTATYEDNENVNLSSTSGEAINLYAIWKEGVAASRITSYPTTYYGKTVNYTANGVSNWKIFYADSSNIFIIASDYIPKAKVSTNAKMTTTGTYQAYWNSAPTTQEVTTALASSFMFSNWTNYSSNRNGKCVSTMLNTENWGGFVNTDLADFAIGGPTLEMYCASWNAKNSSNPMYWNTSSSNSYGYYLAITQNSTSSYYVDMSGVGYSSAGTGYYDTLYYPHREAYSSCSGYWLASPSGLESEGDYQDEEMMRVSYWRQRELRPIRLE